MVEDELKAKAFIDPEFARVVGIQLMNTKPTPDNKYGIKCSDKHMTFLGAVRILQSSNCEIGPGKVKPLHHLKNPANGKNQTDIVVVDLTWRRPHLRQDG